MTPEELLEFDNTVEAPDGASYLARVIGAERDDGQWIGWIRFSAADGGEVLETDRETTQPNRDDLAYWARGLTYFYLEGALARARGRRERSAAGAARTDTPRTAGPDRRGQGAGAGRPPRTRSTPRLEVISPDPTAVEQILGARDPRAGTLREIPDAGTVVYEGSVAENGGRRHLFGIHYGSENAGATLCNWLWSRLHSAGVEVRVNGEPVELTNDGLKSALVGP